MNNQKTDGLKTAIVAGALIALGASVHAQSLQTYFNLTTYGSVAANSTIVDQTGNTHATLNNDGITTITSSGLTSAGGGNSGNNGLTFAAGSLNSFTSSFSIQDWVTTALNNGNNNNVVLYGGNSGAQNSYIGDGYTGVSTLIGFTWGNLVGGGGTGNPLGQPYNRYGNAIGTNPNLTAGSLYDIVLTYDASTYTFNEYVNGSLHGTLQEAFSSTSLAGVQNFAIGGAPGEPWSDGSNQETTSDFLLYNGALSQSQVSALDAAGAGASLASVEAIAPVPEPSTMALSAIGGLALLMIRQRAKR
jgi:hypothetical protein